MGSGLLVEPYISFYKDCIVGGEQASGKVLPNVQTK